MLCANYQLLIVNFVFQFEPKKRLSFIQVVDTLDMLLAQPLDVNNFVESNELKMTTTNTAKMELDKGLHE